METATVIPVVITPEALLQHWQGHRKLTRKVIEAFPEDKLFSYSVGGMRPFSALALEMVHMAGPGVIGVATGRWESPDNLGHHRGEVVLPATKEALLQLWDQITELINTTWPTIAPGRFQQIDKVFNAYEGPIYAGILYLIDNEIHHRGQGYVYLRSLGIEPPAFWDRY